MNLLCHDYIDFKDVNQKFGIDAITYFIDEIKQLGAMQEDKLIDMDAAGNASERYRYDMGARIRNVLSVDGQVWLLEDGDNGRLLHLLPQ